MKLPLAQRTCEPCKGGVPPLPSREIVSLLQELGGDWQAVGTHHLEKRYRFPDFTEALAFVNRVGEIAEREGHHPNIFLSWGRVSIEIWTHKIDGLTEADFILAAKCDAVADR